MLSRMKVGEMAIGPSHSAVTGDFEKSSRTGIVHRSKPQIAMDLGKDRREPGDDE